MMRSRYGRVADPPERGREVVLSSEAAVPSRLPRPQGHAVSLPASWPARGIACHTAKTPDQPSRDWAVAPRLLEDVYSVTDAVVTGSLLITLLRHADRVRIACLAQLVNAIAPIMTEPGGPAWRQATFYPFAMASRHGRGLAVHPESTVIRTAGYGEVPALHAAAVIDDATGAVTVFAVNRSRQAPLELRIGLRGDNLRACRRAQRCRRSRRGRPQHRSASRPRQARCRQRHADLRRNRTRRAAAHVLEHDPVRMTCPPGPGPNVRGQRPAERAP